MNVKKHIPNTITCCNLLSGCIAVYHAFMYDSKSALIFIIIGAVFDFFDGLTARLLHVSSPIGKELDSLADLITFGMAPATLVFSQLLAMNYPSFLYPVSDYLPFLAYVMVAFSALRLAKFNLDERQSHGFIGLPTPANALFWGALIVGAHHYFESSLAMTFLLYLMIGMSSYLLVAEIPMFALKFKQWGWKNNEVKYIFLLSCIPLLVFFKIAAFAIIIAWYIMLSIIVNIRRQRQ